MIVSCEKNHVDNEGSDCQFKKTRDSCFDVKEAFMEGEVKEDIKKMIESEGLVCDCGEKVYDVGKGAIENQPNYNRYFEYLECLICHKLFYL